MTKQEFLNQLRMGISGLPQEDISERLTFYREMIDDRMEEGLSEEEAVAAVGSVDEIISQIVAETPFVKIAKERIKPERGLKAWEIVLLILGAPVWLPICIAIVAVIFSIYVTLWSVIISLWATFASIAIAAIACVFAGVIFVVTRRGISGLAVLGVSLICIGLAIFLFYGCKAITKGIVVLTKKFAVWIKNCFMKKGNE